MTMTHVLYSFDSYKPWMTLRDLWEISATSFRVIRSFPVEGTNIKVNGGSVSRSVEPSFKDPKPQKSLYQG